MSFYTFDTAACGAALSALLRSIVGAAVVLAGTALALERDWYGDGIGGRGGERGETVCEPGAFLVGLNVRYGDDLDAVQALCATPPTAASTGAPLRLTAAPTPTALGGPGGEPETFRCPESAPFVRELNVTAEGTDTVLVTGVEVFCGPLLGPLPKRVWHYNHFGTEPKLVYRAKRFERRLECPETHVPAGLHGSAGRMVHSLGLVCRPVQGGENSLPESRIVSGADGMSTRARHDVLEQVLSQAPGAAAEQAGTGLLSSSILTGSPLDSATVAGEATEELRCRGEASGFSLEQPQADGLAGVSNPLVLYFIAAPGAAGSDNAGLRPGTCAMAHRAMALEDPAAVVFASSRSLQEIAAYLSSEEHYWRFAVRRTNYGYFEAIDNSAWDRAIAGGLFSTAPNLRTEATAASESVPTGPSQEQGGSSASASVDEAEQSGIIIVGGREGPASGAPVASEPPRDPINGVTARVGDLRQRVAEATAIIGDSRLDPSQRSTGVVVNAPTSSLELTRTPTLAATPNPAYVPRGRTEVDVDVRWNAGADTPDSRVLVAMNGGAERELARGHDGSATLKVRLGSFYRVRLVSADIGGRELATMALAGEEGAPAPDPIATRGTLGSAADVGGSTVSQGAPEAVLTQASVGSADDVRDASVTTAFFSEIRVQPLGDAIRFSFETSEPAEIFIEVSETSYDRAARSQVPPTQRLSPAFPDGTALAAFTLPGASGVATRHDLIVRGSGSGLDADTTYYYVVTAKAPDGTYWRLMDELVNTTRSVKVVWDSIHVENDSELGGGEASFFMWVNYGAPGAQWLRTNTFDVEDGVTYPINRSVISSPAGRTLSVSVRGEEDDIVLHNGFDPAGAEPPNSPTEEHYEIREFDLIQLGQGAVVPFEIRSLPNGSDGEDDFEFKINGHFEVSFRGFE